VSQSVEASPAPRVGVVVLNWHGREKTLACLRALAALAHPNFFVLLIDNGCAEFSTGELAGMVGDVRYLRTAGNLGFAGGSNLGMREALAAGAEYVWFLNNDAAPQADALTELLAVAEGDPPADVVGAKILRAADPRRLDSIALAVDLRWGRVRLLGHDETDRGQYDELRDVAAVTGCAMLVRRDACERLGGFDERFFAYLEDADLCLRAGAAGLRVAAAPRARVLHDRPAAGDGRQSPSSLRLTTRNHLLLLERHARGPAWRRRLRAASVLALNLAYALRGGGDRRRRMAAVWQGWREYRQRNRPRAGDAFTTESR
jgi:hypothetical protein